MLDVKITQLAGHKLPTAYPSRRVWLHVVLTDRNGRIVFESGTFQTDGAIAGNDNDADPAQFEPHYAQIETSDQVQIYESAFTTSLTIQYSWEAGSCLAPTKRSAFSSVA